MKVKKNRRDSVRKNETLAVVNQSNTYNKFDLLCDTLNQTKFWNLIETKRKSFKLSRHDFKIIIKPDLEIFDAGSSTGTDSEIVEYLILMLHKKGYKQIAVADGIGKADLWLENRDVMVLADLVGYRYMTDEGKPYDMINLSEDLVDVDFHKSGALLNSKMSRSWVDAHFRINIAKNKTDEENFFSLCLQNLIGILPNRDKDYHYNHRLKSWDVCIDLLKKTPIDFSIIDAYISNHGGDGSRSVNPLPTNTIIASEDLLLADWAAAIKMGLDPYASRINAAALRTIGLPKRYKIKGDLTPYPGWENVSLILSDSVRKRNRSIYINQLVRPWLQSVNRELFPFKNIADDKINGFVTKYLGGEDKNPVSKTALIGLNYLLAGAHNVFESWQIMYDKDKLRHKQVSLGFDAGKYSANDYEAVVDYMEPLAEIAAQTPPDRNGLRWRYIDGSVLFEHSKILPISFDKFVSKVDISKAVRMMNDYIGGAFVPVSFDKHNRIIHQAERNIYLPQPNWMVVFGGTAIDVGKLEFLRYEKTRQQIFWRTVTSDNSSATFDDGIVTFEKAGKGKTKITITTRQKFALPLFWQVVNIDLIPQVKDILVSDAYLTYFSRTMANFEAAFEGRTIVTGQPWKSDFAENPDGEDKMPLDQFKDIFAKSAVIIEPLINHLKGSYQNKQEGGQTNDSPAIFEFGSSARTFLSDLFDAVKKDLGTMNHLPNEENS